jgi:hypothetical protein
MKISLKRFLQTGVLGQLHLGMSAQEVLDMLGPPEFGDTTLGSGSDSWFYGAFSVQFVEAFMPHQGIWSIICHLGETDFSAACVIEDWDIQSTWKPKDIKTFLSKYGLEFRKGSVKGYYERKSVDPRIGPEMAKVAQTMGFLVFKKPKNNSDILRTTRFTTFYLASGVEISFVDEALIMIRIERKREFRRRDE